MSLTLTIESSALTLQLGDNAPLELEIESAALTLELGAIVAFSPIDTGPSRVVLLEDTTLSADGNGNTYVNDDAEIVATLPESADIGAAKYAVRFVLAFAQVFRLQAQGSDVIRWSGVESAAAGYLETSDRDAVVDVEYIGDGVFTVTSAQREWSFGP